LPLASGIPSFFLLCPPLNPSSRNHGNHSITLIAVQPSFSTIRCKTLNIFIKVCYAPLIVTAMPPRRTPSIFPHQIPILASLTPKSHRIISFADPHPLTLLESYRFENRGGGPTPDGSFLSTAHNFPKPFICNTYGSNPASAANKRLTSPPRRSLSPVDATLNKKRGGAPYGRLGGRRRRSSCEQRCPNLRGVRGPRGARFRVYGGSPAARRAALQLRKNCETECSEIPERETNSEREGGEGIENKLFVGRLSQGLSRVNNNYLPSNDTT